MTEEEKQLLIKDLCGRLPYGVICHYNCVTPIEGRELHKANCKDVLKGIIPTYDGHIGFMVGFDKINALEGDIKPYLHPMSSMTEEENNELGELITIYDIVDWMLAHHFDVHNLIEKGLALEALKGMYKTE